MRNRDKNKSRINYFWSILFVLIGLGVGIFLWIAQGDSDLKNNNKVGDSEKNINTERKGKKNGEIVKRNSESQPEAKPRFSTYKRYYKKMDYLTDKPAERIKYTAECKKIALLEFVFLNKKPGGVDPYMISNLVLKKINRDTSNCGKAFDIDFQSSKKSFKALAVVGSDCACGGLYPGNKYKLFNVNYKFLKKRLVIDIPSRKKLDFRKDFNGFRKRRREIEEKYVKVVTRTKQEMEKLRERFKDSPKTPKKKYSEQKDGYKEKLQELNSDFKKWASRDDAPITRIPIIITEDLFKEPEKEKEPKYQKINVEGIQVPKSRARVAYFLDNITFTARNKGEEQGSAIINTWRKNPENIKGGALGVYTDSLEVDQQGRRTLRLMQYKKNIKNQSVDLSSDLHFRGENKKWIKHTINIGERMNESFGIDWRKKLNNPDAGLKAGNEKIFLTFPGREQPVEGRGVYVFAGVTYIQDQQLLCDITAPEGVYDLYIGKKELEKNMDWPPE